MSYIDTIEIDDSRYPALLSLIKDSPEKLYYIGDIGLLSKSCIAIVGARKCTEYGKWAAYTLAKRLSEHGVVVVSGMAEGIDSMAHKGALAGGTPTVAVMGTGLDICFPVFNQKLREEILRKGLIVSELPEGVQGSRFTFPLRNRIISGLSVATVVAEAGLSSGSLITAEYAAKQGRQVYAIPGNINRSMSMGANKLIRDGAMPLLILDDLLYDMGLTVNPGEDLARMLSKEEKDVYTLICEQGEISINDIAASLGLSAGNASALVCGLEIKGLISFSFGRAFKL